MQRAIGRLRARAGGFNPSSYFGSNLLVWIDRSDSSLAWQDSARTTPAVIGQPVGSRQNKGTLSLFMQQATAGSRAVLTQDGSGNLYDAYDGLDDGSLSSATANFSTTNKVTVCLGITKEFDGAAAIPTELSANSTVTDGGFYVGAPDRPAAAYGFSIRGTTIAASGIVSGFASPIAKVVTCVYDTSAGTVATQIATRVNSVAQTLTPDAGSPTSAGNFANATLYEGRRGNASLPYTGRIYQTLIVSGALSAGDLVLLERFVGSKMGIAL